MYVCAIRFTFFTSEKCHVVWVKHVHTHTNKQTHTCSAVVYCHTLASSAVLVARGEEFERIDQVERAQAGHVETTWWCGARELGACAVLCMVLCVGASLLPLPKNNNHKVREKTINHSVCREVPQRFSAVSTFKRYHVVRKSRARYRSSSSWAYLGEIVGRRLFGMSWR